MNLSSVLKGSFNDDVVTLTHDRASYLTVDVPKSHFSFKFIKNSQKSTLKSIF
jgi:hypothetical protein